MQKFQEYPKVLRHPSHAPATFITAPGKGVGLFAPETTIKTVEKFPDVTVVDLKQEQLMASRGYRPVNQNLSEEDYQIAVLEQTVPENKFQKFPKWRYHPVEAPVIVHSQAEEDAQGEGWQDLPIIATEDDEVPEVVSKPRPAIKKAQHKIKKAKNAEATA